MNESILPSIFNTTTRHRYKKGGKWNNSSRRVVEIDRHKKDDHAFELAIAKGHEDMKRPNKTSKVFYEWVISNYKRILTAKQAQYVEGIINGLDGNYNRYTTYRFRRNISTRLTVAYVGEGAVGMRPAIMVEYRRTIDLLERLILSGDNNEVFTALLLSSAEHPVIKSIIWEGVSQETRSWILHRELYGKECKIPVKNLSEIYDHLQNSLEKYHARGLR